MNELNERYESHFKLQEMAKIGSIDDLVIEVYTDHTPIHFHVVKKNEFDVRVKLADLTILSYKYQNKGKKITSQEMKKVITWLNQKNKKKPSLTNKDAIEFAWSIMNEEVE